MTIAVVVTSKNKGKYLRRALDSLLAQTRRPDEVILVDHGSTDSTFRFADHEAVTKYVTLEEGGGPGRAKNYGALKASAEYLSFLDGDDELTPEALESLSCVLRANIPVSHGIVEVNSTDGTKYVEGGPKKIHTCAMLCRADIFGATRGFMEEIPVSEDRALWLKLSSYLDWLRLGSEFVPRIVYRYHRVVGSQTRDEFGRRPNFVRYDRQADAHASAFSEGLPE